MMRGEMMAGGIVLLRLSGLVTADAHQRFAAEGCARWGHEARGFIVDYRACALAVDPSKLTAAVFACQPGSPMRRPGAFVCGHATRDALRAHAQATARAGIWRRTFMDSPSAHAWLVSLPD